MSRVGRPSKYNNQHTLEQLQEQVYLYRKETPSGLIKISDMVRFSDLLNGEDPVQFSFFSKDVWSNYGRTFIDTANEPISVSFILDQKETVQIPNIADIVEKHGNHPQKMLEYLLPIESFIHTQLSREQHLRELLNKQEEELKLMKQKLRTQEDLVNRYQSFVLTMSHESYRKDHESLLVNQVSVNANDRNKKAMRNVGELGEFLYTAEHQEIDKSSNNKSTFLTDWRAKRGNDRE